MTPQRVLEFVYGPHDGDHADLTGIPDQPVLVTTWLRHAPTGHPLLARYLPATALDEELREREVLVFEGWFVNQPGDAYGPKTGGMKHG